MTVPTVTDITMANAAWANQVAADVNALLSSTTPAAIIELATSPAPAGGIVGSLVWSTVHSALMRWTGTQWVFVDGAPNYYTYDDFYSASGNATGTQMGGGTFSANVDSAGHYGQDRIDSVAVANSGARVGFGSGSGSFITAAGLRMRAIFSPTTTAANSVQRIGFHDQTVGATPPTDGAWLEIVAGIASFKTSAAGTATTHGTTALLSAGTWYYLHVIFTAATTVRLILLTEGGTVVLDLTQSTNVPTGANKVCAIVEAHNTIAAAVHLLDTDWIGMGYAV